MAPAAVDGLQAGPAPAPGLSAERIVALTDLALGAEAAAFAVMLGRDERSQGSPLRGPLITLFAATSAASLAGAALHGLTTDRSDPRPSRPDAPGGALMRIDSPIRRHPLGGPW